MSLILEPKDEEELISRCAKIEGLSFSMLASSLGLVIPDNPVHRKGWTGQAIEMALGAKSTSLSQPDFNHLGIELKTLPLNHLGRPKESTFVTTISLLTIHKETWDTSSCLGKLKKVLWLPIEGDTSILFHHRRIGRAILWSPTLEQYNILANDWCELTLMISTGRLSEIDATFGEYLQIRPKGATAKSLCYCFDELGNKVKTLPRGFYLRPSFTASVLI